MLYSNSMTIAKRNLRDHATQLLDGLRRAHPDFHCALNHSNPLQLLIATILSAQCTDERVNMVTPALFARFPDANALANAKLPELEALIHSTGFYKNKAKSIVGCCRALVEKHKGNVPATMEELVKLPGVGRKTANVVLGVAFQKAEGIVVDTHVHRLARRLGLTRQNTPEKIEAALMNIFPRDEWIALSHLLIFHGRRRCTARNPDCEYCEVAGLCPQWGVPLKKSRARSA
jgi:endonuclease-3